MNFHLLLVRHAESEIPRPGLEDEMTRPLTQRGEIQAQSLAPAVVAYRPTALYSSPYRRAVQTLEPAAAQLGFPIVLVEGFREHRMANHPIADWRDVLAKQWADPHFRPETGDPFTETAERGWNVILQLAERHPDTRVALAGHGTIISLMIARLEPEFGLEHHLAMPTPATFDLRWDGQDWHWES